MDDRSSLSPGLTQVSTATSPTFAPQPVPKNPGIAFLLSLIFPGAGQFYCGKLSRGLWILAIFFLGLQATIYLATQLGDPDGKSIRLLWGAAFRITVFIYVFAFLDAFFTAREMTAGTDPFVAESPRIAAVLNLLTRGFGYFYLGNRALGLWVFVGLWVLQSTARNMKDVKDVRDQWGVALVLELVPIGLAVDAYRMARKRERQILATIRLPPRTSGNFPAAIPVGLGLLLGAGYFAVAARAFYQPNYTNIDQSTARVVRNGQDSIYDNPAYGVSLAVPGSWTIEHQKRGTLAFAIREDHGCLADLRPHAWSFLLGLDPYKIKLDYQISQGDGLKAKILDEQPIVVSGLSARDIRLSVKRESYSLVEHRIIARRGMTLYVLTTDQLAADDATPADPSCTSDLQFIRDHLRLPH